MAIWQQTDRGRPGQLLLRWRWFVLAIAVPISLVIELAEGSTHDLQFLDEVIIDGLILPISTWAILTFAAQKIAQQYEREEQLKRRQQFLHELAEYRDYQALTKFIVRFCSTTLPVAYAGLLVREEQHEPLRMVAEWRAPDHMLVNNKPTTGIGRSYDFILLQNQQQLGILQIRYLPTIQPDQHQLNFMSDLIPDISQAMIRALQESRQTAQVYREAQAYERRRIMQELHDSLAQQVFYLHLGLDQLADQHAVIAANESLQRKITSMRNVAADVYEQIRNNLSVLRAWEQVNLTEAISELARATAHQHDLHVDIDLQGEPSWLSPHTCEHVFGMVREGLNNIVKHAHAQRVLLKLHWAEDQLQLTLSDDGVGFDLTRSHDGHYGLALMREAIDALQGSFVINSTPDQGTTLTVQIPLRPIESPLSPAIRLSNQIRTSLESAETSHAANQAV